MTILEQCRIFGIKKSTYYENLKNEEARLKRKAEEDKIRVEHAKKVFDEWLKHDTYGYQKMARHLKKWLNL